MRPSRSSWRTRWLLAGAAWCLAAIGVAAQEERPAGAEPAVAEQAGVTLYPAAYFAEFNPDTAMDMINRLPGFAFDGGSGARGFSGNEGNVLIDGERPPSRGDSLSNVIRRIPASEVERIDVIRGGAPGIDMQGKPVVANIIRRAGSGGLQGAVQVASNLNERGQWSPQLRLEGQRRSGERLIEGSLFVLRDNYFNESDRERLALDGAPLRLTLIDGEGRFDRMDVTGAFEAPLAGGSFRANTLLSTTENASTQEDFQVLTGLTDLSSNVRERDSGEVGLRYSREIWRGIGLEAVAFQQLTDTASEGFFADRGSFNERQTGETIGSLSLRLPKLSNWALELGGEVAFNWLENDTDVLNAGVILNIPSSQIRVEELRSETWVTGTWSRSPKLSIETGLRYERSTITAQGPDTDREKSLAFPKPRINIAWTPREGHIFGLRYERIVDQLSFDDFAASASLEDLELTAGNPDLEPAKHWFFEARYERRFGRQGSILLQYIQRDYQDLLGEVLHRVLVEEEDPDTGQIRVVEKVFSITTNVNDAVRDVVFLTMALPMDKVGLPGGLLRTRGAWRTSTTIDAITGEEHRISGEPSGEWEVGISQDVPGGKLRWGLSVFGVASFTNYDAFEVSVGVEGFGSNAFVEYRPRPDLKLNLQVLNLGATGFERNRVYYEAGRDQPNSAAFVERRRFRNSPSAYMSLRKSF